MEENYDKKFAVVFEAIRKLMETPETPKKRIGFEVKEQRACYGRN
jgi:hypothetical protein